MCDWNADNFTYLIFTRWKDMAAFCSTLYTISARTGKVGLIFFFQGGYMNFIWCDRKYFTCRWNSSLCEGIKGCVKEWEGGNFDSASINGIPLRMKYHKKGTIFLMSELSISFNCIFYIYIWSKWWYRDVIHMSLN